MNNNAEGEAHVILQFAIEFKIVEFASFDVSRVVINLKNADVNAPVNFYVQTAADSESEIVFLER